MYDPDGFEEYQRTFLPYQRPQQDPEEVQPQRPQPVSTKKRATAQRMPKTRALTLLRKMKRGIVVASFLGFGAFGVLAMNHGVGTTQAAATTSSTQKSTSSTPTTQQPAATATQQPTATATQQPTATPTTTSQGGSYGFGSGNSTSSTPVSGSHTS